MLLAFPPVVMVGVATDAVGGFALPFVTPAGLPSTLEITLQVALMDGAAVKGVSLSNAVQSTIPWGFGAAGERCPRLLTR